MFSWQVQEIDSLYSVADEAMIEYNSMNKNKLNLIMFRYVPYKNIHKNRETDENNTEIHQKKQVLVDAFIPHMSIVENA